MYLRKTHQWPFILCLVVSFIGQSRGDLEEDFAPGQAGTFASQADCKGDEFNVEEYTSYPNITRPHGSNNYFLKVAGVGCMVTNPIRFEKNSQIMMTYMSVSPGIRLRIIIGDKVFEPNLNLASWNTFTKDVDIVSEEAQVKFLAEVTGGEGQPLLIIDSFKVTPRSIPARGMASTNEPSTESKSNIKTTIATKTTIKETTKKSTLSETTTPAVDDRAKKEFEYEADDSDEYPDPYAFLIRPRVNPRVLQSLPKHEEKSTDIAFWFYLSIFSFLVILLLYFALFLLTRALVRANCV